MDMGSMSSSSSASCKISMLWNWYTVDACFLANSWHVRSRGMFAGSVIGVFFLVIAIEAVRRAGREYDRRLVQAAMAGLGGASISSAKSDTPPGEMARVSSGQQITRFTPSWPQQILRGLVYGSQFTAAFLVMLLGMYYNGYILFAIFIGQTVGYIVFGRDTCGGAELDCSGSCC